MQPFGDIESALIADLKAKCGVPVSEPLRQTDTRPKRFVTVNRGGGAQRDIVTDAPNIEFECWAETRADAAALAQTVRAEVKALVGQTIGGMTVYGVNEFAGPAHLRHPIETQHRYVYTAAIHVRYPR
jgi:hypothetical protein